MYYKCKYLFQVNFGQEHYTTYFICLEHKNLNEKQLRCNILPENTKHIKCISI